MSETQTNYNWLCSIIDSCNNTFHFEVVDNMIELYYKKYQSADMYDLLLTQRELKWRSVHNILS